MVYIGYLNYKKIIVEISDNLIYQYYLSVSDKD